MLFDKMNQITALFSSLSLFCLLHLCIYCHPDKVGYNGCRKQTAVTTKSNVTTLFVHDSANMTVHMCVTLCWQQQKKIALLQNGTICNCTDSSLPNFVTVPDFNCPIMCPGNCKQICGGPNAVSSYLTGYKQEPNMNFLSNVTDGFISCLHEEFIPPCNVKPITNVSMILKSHDLTTDMCAVYCLLQKGEIKYSVTLNQYTCCCLASLNVRKSSKLIPNGSAYCNINCGGGGTTKCYGLATESQYFSVADITKIKEKENISYTNYFNSTDAFLLSPPFPDDDSFEYAADHLRDVLIDHHFPENVPQKMPCVFHEQFPVSKKISMKMVSNVLISIGSILILLSGFGLLLILRSYVKKHKKEFMLR